MAAHDIAAQTHKKTSPLLINQRCSVWASSSVNSHILKELDI